MTHLHSLIDMSMYNALTDQHEVVILSNKLNIITNNLLGCESDETNE